MQSHFMMNMSYDLSSLRTLASISDMCVADIQLQYPLSSWLYRLLKRLLLQIESPEISLILQKFWKTLPETSSLV